LNNPLRDTPAEVTERITAWGGTNEYGDPNWRVILAQNHLVQRAGMWTDFDEDIEQVHFEPGHHGLKYTTQRIAPERIRIGILWVPRYQVEGWVLERWFSSAAYGSRESWEAALSQDGITPMMGPFPEHGGYMMLSGGGPWEEIPNLEDLRAAISSWENDSHLHGQFDEENLVKTMRDEMAAIEEDQEQRYAKLLAEVTYLREHNLLFLKGNPALSEYRNKLVNQAGITEHY
jgi:hypothetical protein